MQNVKEMVIVALGVLLAFNLASCSSTPKYEKMSTIYVIKLDMRHDESRRQVPVDSSKYRPEVIDENMVLMDGLLNKELKEQLAN